ncbi:MAG: hypothetical protein AAFV53_35130 [Myxococcota bacterium]
MLWLWMSMMANASEPLWPPLDTPPKLGGGRHDAAVIVAIEDYAFVSDIPGARQNAQDWYRFLTAGRSVPAGQVQMLLDGNATNAAVRVAIEEMTEAVGPDGRLWFIFIGHGAPSKDGTDGLLLDVDVRQTALSVADRGLPQSELIERLEQGDQRETVAILDACFSGKVGDGQPLVRGLMPLVPTYATPTGRKTTILSAGGSDEFAGPLPGADRPAFSYLTLGAMFGWADENNDRTVSSTEASSYARGALRGLLTDRQQRPTVSGPTIADLSSGRERGPDLANIALTLSETMSSPTELESALAELETLQAQDAERSRRAAALQAELDAEIARLTQNIQREAAAVWQRVSAIAEMDGDTGIQALEAFITEYTGRTVTLGDRVVPVDIPELEAAHRRLAGLNAGRGERVNNPAVGAAIVVPAGWALKSAPDADLTRMVHPQTASQIEVLGKQTNRAKEARIFTRAFLDNLIRSPSYTPLGEETVTVMGGKEGVRADFRFSETGADLNLVAFTFIDNARAVVAMGYFTPDAKDRDLAAFDAVIAKMAFEDAGE